jgi:hypothetical protein
MVMEVRQQRVIDATHNNAIYTQYKCEVSGCPNKKAQGWCIIVDGVHLKILPQQATTWSIAINEGRADIENAPPELLRTLMPAKTGQVNPLRNPAPHPPAQTATLAPPTHVAPPPPLPPATPYPHYPYHPPPSYPYYSPFAMPNPYPYIPPPPSAPPQNEQPQHQRPSQTLRSSSIGADVDTAEQLKDYIAWMIRRSPSHATAFKAAQMALLDKFHTIDTISNVTDKQFSEMGIEDGLVTQFRTLLVKYQRKTLNHR